MIIKREILLETLKSSEFDLLVIGGGITGAGIALDAASRGLHVALVEKGDFASGTSSKSTKLIHGGLRYLKQYQLGIVHEVGKERAILHHLAIHLIKAEKMLLPIYKGGSFGKIPTTIGLAVYDFLAGVKSIERHQILKKEEVNALEPSLEIEGLIGAGFYTEYRTDDARLTIEVVKTAIRHGAVCLNYLEAKDFLKTADKINGAVCQDKLSGERIEVYSKTVINAAGPWVDELRGLDNSLFGKRLLLSKGIHAVVPHARLPLCQSIYFDAPDGRMVFAIPRQQSTYLGTTDTVFEGDKNAVFALENEVNYLLKAANAKFPKANLSQSDVESTWAGLRPLIYEEGKSVGELSRKDEIIVSKSGLISIAGGKLTGYRKMAEKMVDLILKMKKQTPIVCMTKHIHLTEDPFETRKELEEFYAAIMQKLEALGLPTTKADYLIENYGRQAQVILEKTSGPADDKALILAELEFCLHEEMVQNPADFLERRTGLLYFDIKRVRQHLQTVLDFFQAYFNWTETKRAAEELHIIALTKSANPFSKG